MSLLQSITEELTMTNVFDITAFGAIGDGATDCTAAIQTALDRASDIHGCVTVPPGTYLTGKLTLRAHTRLEGKSAWSFRSDGLSVLQLNDPTAPCLLDITGAFGSTIAGVCMNGDHLGENTHGISLSWERYNGGSEEDTPSIEDCRIGNFSGDGVHLEHIWCFSIRHSMLHRNGGSGLYIDGWDGFLIDNWFTANTKAGILGGPCTASVTATGNRVEWNILGGFKFPAGSHVNITGNYFDRTFGPALWLGEETGGTFRDTTVTGNIFYRSGCPDRGGFSFEDYESSHVYLAKTINVTVTGNTFKHGVNDDGKGTRSPAYGLVVTNSDAVIAQSNVMRDGFMKQGIVWDHTGECLIKDNMT